MKITTWFTFFFIPIIPYRRQYYLVCPICKAGEMLAKEDFKQLIEDIDAGRVSAQTTPPPVQASGNGNAPSMEEPKYAGKTPTQIAYLKQMEELENSRNSEV